MPAVQLPAAIAEIRAEAQLDDKSFVLSRLTDIALADGALIDSESAVILDIAKQIDVPIKLAYSIMIGAAQSVGFRSDVKLNRMAEQIRRSMALGLKH